MNILVIDDHPLMRDAVVQVIGRLSSCVSVTSACDCEQGLAAAARSEPDLVMLDLDLPGLSGLPALRTWRERHPAVPVVVLSAAEQPAMVNAALAAGAAGYVPKSTPSELMLSAVRLVMDGGRYLPPVLLEADRAAGAPALPSDRPVPAADGPAALRALGLTPRQLDVLRLLARGVPNKVIGRELGLAERTVKAHVTAILRAMGLGSRTQVALAAARLGIAADRGAESPPQESRP
jgi:DNA-binding NarL/FixJ family response regulator